MTKSEWLEQATTEALNDTREAAQAEGREPTAEEFATAINSIGEPPKRRRRVKREPVDKRQGNFEVWMSVLSSRTWLEYIEQAPGGFDPVLFAQGFLQDEWHSEYCLEQLHKAIGHFII